MEAKTVILLLCVAQALGKYLPEDTADTRAWSVYDQEHGQYSMALLSTETTVLRYRTYVLLLETTHTVKYNDQEILALFNASGTDPAKITALQTEFTKRGDTITTNLQRIMNASIDLVAVTNTINQDISGSQTGAIAMDKALLIDAKSDFDTIYSLAMENSEMAASLAYNKIIITIGAQTGTEMDEIRAIADESKALLLKHKGYCDSQKLTYVDPAYVIGINALQKLIDTAPAP